MRILAFIVIAATACGQSLPDGPGKAVTERMCKGCHGIENVVRAKRTKEAWIEVVDDMVARGAKGTDDEVDLVIEYLATHFGPNSPIKVNINKAMPADLTAGLGISSGDAAAIVRYRADKGPFKSIQDVQKVPNIDTKKIDSVQERIEF